MKITGTTILLILNLIAISIFYIVDSHLEANLVKVKTSVGLNTKIGPTISIPIEGPKKMIDMEQFEGALLNLAYANNNNSHQTLDIVYPSKGTAPYKTIVLLHGGGWVIGDKRSPSHAPIFQAITQGYAVATINYRLSTEVLWPKQLHDSKAAIRFLRANSEKFQLDTKNILVWGLSAGGHLAQMLAATNNQSTYEDLEMGNKDFSSAVQGVISWYGISDLTKLTVECTNYANRLIGVDVLSNLDQALAASPISLVTKDFPPLLLVHGTADELVPYEQAIQMQELVNQKTRGKAILKTLDEAPHSATIFKSIEELTKDFSFVDQVLYEGQNPFRNTEYKESIALKATN